MGEETALEKLFKSMDKDGDGTVTKEVTVIIVIIVIVIAIITVIIIITTHACFYAPRYICFYLLIIHDIYEYFS